MESNQYYVQIRDSMDIRRSILGSSKQIIQILQRYERIKSLRVQKLEKIKELKDLNKEIKLSIVKLTKVLPKADVRVQVAEPKRSRGKRRAVGDDLGKLESDLRMIENKLGRLS